MNDPKKPYELFQTAFSFGTAFWLGFLMVFTVLAVLLGPVFWQALEVDPEPIWEDIILLLAFIALSLFGGMVFKATCALLTGICRSKFKLLELLALAILVALLVLLVHYTLQHGVSEEPMLGF